LANVSVFGRPCDQLDRPNFGADQRFFTKVLPNSSLDDPVYKKNVQKLIERNRRFEESKE